MTSPAKRCSRTPKSRKAAASFLFSFSSSRSVRSVSFHIVNEVPSRNRLKDSASPWYRSRPNLASSSSAMISGRSRPAMNAHEDHLLPGISSSVTQAPPTTLRASSTRTRLSCAGEVVGGDEAVVAGADDDGVVVGCSGHVRSPGGRVDLRVSSVETLSGSTSSSNLSTTGSSSGAVSRDALPVRPGGDGHDLDDVDPSSRRSARRRRRRTRVRRRRPGTSAGPARRRTSRTPRR